MNLVLAHRARRTHQAFIKSGGARWMRAGKDHAALPFREGREEKPPMRAVNDHLTTPHSSF